LGVSELQAREFVATIRRRNQFTIPKQIADLLSLHDGDKVVIVVKDGSAIMRPVRKSYAGIGRGVYGDANEYVARERAGWD
jgi:AbrB family looped-hinge helix DNA binding protein